MASRSCRPGSPAARRSASASASSSWLRRTSPIDPLADALLFNAARRQLVTEVIEPALAAGTTVICARFADSTRAYQGYGEGLPLAELDRLEAIATGGLRPDRTILLDLPVEIGLARKAPDDQTRFETGFDVVLPPARPQRVHGDGRGRADPVRGRRRERRRRRRRPARWCVPSTHCFAGATAGDEPKPARRTHSTDE